MWVFTKDGFFSIVRHQDDPWSFLVRARVREDLERAFGPLSSDLKIIEMDNADYRFRATISELHVRNYLANTVSDIDYTTNVKGNLDQGEPDRHRAMMNVWDAMYDLQERRYGR